MAFFDDDGSGVCRIESVLDIDRDVLLHCREKSTGMDDLCTEVGHLHHLEEGKRIDNACFGDHSGVRGHNAVHIGPDDDLIGIDAGADDRTRVIRSAPAKCSYGSFAGTTGESLNDRDLSTKFCSDTLHDPWIAFGKSSGSAVNTVGEDACIAAADLKRRDACLAKRSRDDRGREFFTKGNDVIP